MSSEIKYSNEKYIKSCLWWIEEYFKGDCTKKQFDEAISALKEYADKKYKSESIK